MSDPVQQPVLVYPNGVNVQPQSQTLQSSHSNKESFGASFIVLAVIIVVSAAACFLSRLCNKSGQKKKKHKEVKVMKKGHVGGGHTFPPEQSRRKEMDMEFGFGAARVGPGFDHHHQQQQQQQGKQGIKGSDFEIGFDKKTRQTKGSDIEMGFDRRVGNNGSKGAPVQPNGDMMRGQQQQQPYHHPTGVMNGEANRHFNGGRWPGGQ